MIIVVTNITWQNATKPLPTRMRVEVEDDTSAEDLPNQIKYALWRATGSTPVAYDLPARQGGGR